MSSIFPLSQFNLGGTWQELHLSGIEPTSQQVNIGCYIHDLDTGIVYYRTINGNIIIISFNGSTVPVATPTSLGIVYGLVDNETPSSGNTGLGLNTLHGITGTNNTALGENNLINSTISGTTTVGYSNTATTSLTDNITIGSNNTINAANTIVIGNNIDATTSNILYLDSTIKGINGQGLISSTPATYGIIQSNGILSVGPITTTVTPASPTIIGGVYGVAGNSTNMNTAIGLNALVANTNGTINTALGYKALTGNQTGNDNVAVGAESLSAITQSSYNTAIGTLALQSLSDVSSPQNNNTALGYTSLYNLVGGTNNVSVGNNFNNTSNPITGNSTTTLGSGNNSQTTGTVNLTDNITIGSNNTINAANNTVIGNGNTINGSNTIVVGNNVTVPATASNSLYLDPTITSLIGPGLITGTTANYGLVATTISGVTTLRVGPLTNSNNLTVYYYCNNSDTLSVTSNPTTVNYPNVITDTTNNQYTSGVFTASIQGTYKYKYQIATSSLISSSTILTFQVFTHLSGSPPISINTVIDNLDVIVSGSPVTSLITLIGTVTLSVNETIYSTISGSSSLTVNLNNSYLKIGYL
jgi:predicted lipoprotein with Yx(FWY)xxD motif